MAQFHLVAFRQWNHGRLQEQMLQSNVHLRVGLFEVLGIEYLQQRFGTAMFVKSECALEIFRRRIDDSLEVLAERFRRFPAQNAQLRCAEHEQRPQRAREYHYHGRVVPTGHWPGFIRLFIRHKRIFQLLPEQQALEHVFERETMVASTWV